jgi:hypothetical protein
MIAGLVLLGVAALIFAGWCWWQAWLGHWRAVAIGIGLAYLLSAILVAIIYTGGFKSGHSEDWGPLLAWMITVTIAFATTFIAVLSGLVGYLGHRSRNVTGTN